MPETPTIELPVQRANGTPRPASPGGASLPLNSYRPRRPTTRPGSRQRFALGRRLRAVAGVDEELLDWVPEERARYTRLGAIILNTGLLAGLSLATALTTFLHVSLWIVLPVALVWAYVIVSFDGWLIASTHGVLSRSKWRMFLPRLVISLLMGAAIAEPLVLWVFDAAIHKNVLDVRQAMMAARDKERLYHKTDTHWNQRGAFIAYQEMIKAIRERVPAVPPPLTRDDFESTSRILLGQDLAGMMGLKRSMQEEDLRLTPKQPRRYVVIEPKGAYATAGEPRIVTEIPGSTLPRAVMFRDSYTSWLAPFLSEHFSRIVYLWQNDFDAAVVEQEAPDVVIQTSPDDLLTDQAPSSAPNALDAANKPNVTVAIRVNRPSVLMKLSSACVPASGVAEMFQ